MRGLLLGILFGLMLCLAGSCSTPAVAAPNPQIIENKDGSITIPREMLERFMAEKWLLDQQNRAIEHILEEHKKYKCS